MTKVWVNGCFDILHVGHIRLLTYARSLGDHLIVGLNSDSSTRSLKGDARPIHPQNERAEVMMALRCVDSVVVFDEISPLEAMKRCMPIDIVVKGADYFGKEYHERPWLYEKEIEIVYYELTRNSTTGIVSMATAHETKDSIYRDSSVLTSPRPRSLCVPVPVCTCDARDLRANHIHSRHIRYPAEASSHMSYCAYGRWLGTK